jgi:F-type H+-transporting ATPase subunit b
MGRLREMDVHTKASLAAALETSSESVVRSAFDIPASQRATIQDTLSETFGTKVRLRFETSPDTVCGIELTAGDQKLAWSIAEYLANLEKKVKSLVEAPNILEAQNTPARRSVPSASIPATVLQ